MTRPFRKKITEIPPNMEAMTKGFLEPGGVFDWHDRPDVDEFFLVLSGTGKISFKIQDDKKKKLPD
jgi:mannose-6-phosphate isomerase-like protein (cupin superfamily)